jgi:hypothetical protein
VALFLRIAGQRARSRPRRRVKIVCLSLPYATSRVLFLEGFLGALFVSLIRPDLIQGPAGERHGRFGSAGNPLKSLLLQRVPHGIN